MLHVRLAALSDAPELRRMNLAFNDVDDIDEADIRRSLLVSPEVVLIAEYNGVPAGFCCAQVHHSFCYPTPVAEVTEIYVEEGFRRRGCASAMLSFLEAHLAIRGVDEIHLLTGTTNAAARAAYKKAGFRCKNEVFMTKSIRQKG